MKQFILVLVSALGMMCASAQKFTYDPEFKRTFQVELKEGEEMKVELSSADQLNVLPNPDSLIRLLHKALADLDDTLTTNLYPVHIYYIAGDSADAVIRVKKWPLLNQQFIIVNGEVSRFKDVQDTVVIEGWTAPEKLYRFTFYLNFIGNLKNYTDSWLQEQMATLKENMDGAWVNAKTHYYLKGAPGITAPAPSGKPVNKRMLLIRPSIDIQNYREAFIPSISLGLTVARNHAGKYYEYGISSEVHFRFGNDMDGNSRTYINSFITAHFGKGWSTESGFAPNRLFPYVSLSYSPNNKGNVYREDHTFRLGVGRFFLGNKTTKIEPGIYVDGAFKSATPSLRLVQAF